MFAPTNDPQKLHWFAVQTRHHHEKRVAERLQSLSLETFLPTHRAVHRWKNGIHAEVVLPLFPSYVFARVHSQQRVRLLQDPGVISIAASSSSPTPIPDGEIENLRFVVGTYRAQPHPYLAIGDRVKIIAGPLTGMEGILVRRKQELRVVLSIDAILRAVSVEVSELEIEPVSSRHTLAAS